LADEISSQPGLKLAAHCFDLTPEKEKKWFSTFEQFFSDKYETLFRGVGFMKDDVVIWWGKKISD